MGLLQVTRNGRDEGDDQVLLAFVLPGIKPDGNRCAVALAFLFDDLVHQAHQGCLTRSPVAEDTDGDGAMGIKRRVGQHFRGVLKCKPVVSLAFENRLIA